MDYETFSFSEISFITNKLILKTVLKETVFIISNDSKTVSLKSDFINAEFIVIGEMSDKNTKSLICLDEDAHPNSISITEEGLLIGSAQDGVFFSNITKNTENSGNNNS